MRLLPLLPGTNPSAGTESPADGPPAAHRLLSGDDHACRFCGFRAAAWQEIVLLNAQPHTACPLCHAVLDLTRPSIDEELAVIWLEELTQAALNSLVRGIHLTLHAQGAAPHYGQRPKRDTAASRAAYRAYGALAERRIAAERRIGSAVPSDLAAALLDLTPEAYARHGELLGGLRLLHLGRRFHGAVDRYPEIVAAWATPAILEQKASP